MQELKIWRGERRGGNMLKGEEDACMGNEKAMIVIVRFWIVSSLNEVELIMHKLGKQTLR